MIHLRNHLLLLVPILALVIACGDEEKARDRSDNPPEDPTAPAFEIVAESSEVRLVQGGEAFVRLRLEREEGFEKPITVTARELPSGVFADAREVLPGDSDELELKVSATEEAAIGTATFSIRATAGDQSETAEVSLFVAAPAGSPDADFGEDGIATTAGLAPLGILWPYSYDAAVLPDDSFLLLSSSGTKTASGGSDYTGSYLFRYSADGRLDEAFGEDGVLRFGEGEGKRECGTLAAEGSSLLLGCAVLAANPESGADLDTAIFRLSADGAVDDAFGEGGEARIEWDAATVGGPAALVVDGEGRVVLATSIRPVDGSPSDDAPAFARLLADGTVDATFGEDGYLAPARQGVVTALVALEGGGYLAAGTSSGDGIPVGFALKLTAAGEEDVTFGDEGWAFLDAPVVDAAEGPEGQLFLLVEAQAPEPGGVAALDGEGKSLPGFNGGAPQLFTGIEGGAILVGADASIYVAGKPTDDAGPSLLRLGFDGSLDEAFATRTAEAAPSDATWLGQQSDGRILLAGHRRDPPDTWAHSLDLQRFWP